MKKLIRILCVFLLLFSVVACNEGGGNEPDTPKEENNPVAGKTYYNALFREGQTDYSKIWFGKDKSFVFKDYHNTEAYEATGTYEVNENVIKLTSENPTDNSYAKIIFEFKDNTVVLKNDLTGSKMDDVFYDTKPEPTYLESKGYVYYSVDTKSFVELHEDHTFSFTEIEGMGAIEIVGKWGKEGDVYMFSDFDPIYDCNGEKLYNFEFMEYNFESIILLTDIQASKRGDMFTLTGKVTVGDDIPDGPISDNLGDYGSTWVHEPIQDVLEQYTPSIELNTAGEFVFTENVYAGMAQIKGFYSKTEKGYELNVEDASQMQGFAGQDVKKIVLENVNENTVVLKTDICMSRIGDKFNKK